ncbi:MAG: multicopper oxidase domain-containing protein [Candidatus Nanohalobium sp.]
MNMKGQKNLLLVAIISLTSTVAAHAGHSTSSKAYPAVNISTSATVGIIIALLFVFGVLVLLTSPNQDLPKLTLGLIALALLAGLTGIFFDTGSEEQKIKETYGPSRSPLHMQGFYEGFEPAKHRHAKDIVRNPGKVPEPIERNSSKAVEILLEAQERVSHLTENSTYYYWTYNGTVPGPILRVQEGDTVKLTLKNEEISTHNHSIDLHAVNGPGGGAKVLEVSPGENKTAKFKALNSGFYVYHCGTSNVPTHIANGMYGGIIVEPREGLPEVDKRFTVFQGEVYTQQPMGAEGFQAFSPEKLLNEEPTYYTFNGRPHGVTGEEKLKAEVNDTVRIFFGNMGNSKISSFHAIGEQFKRVWPHGSLATRPQGPGVQTVPVAAGSSAVVDLQLENPGKYTIVDHALARLDRGAWGVLEVSGEKNPDVYAAK